MVKRVIGGVYKIGQGPGISAYAVDGDGITIVDAGVQGKLQAFVDALDALGRTPDEVTRILVSHYHQDHVGNLKALAELTGATVFAPAEEAEAIRAATPAPQMQQRGALGAAFSAITARSFGNLEREPAPVHEELKGGDVLPDGIEAIATPGHTAGHLSYLLPSYGGVLFVGDAAANLVTLDLMPVNEDFDLTEQSFVALGKREFHAAMFTHGRDITSNASIHFQRAARRYTR